MDEIFVAQSATGTFVTFTLQPEQYWSNSSCIALTMPSDGGTSDDVMMRTSPLPFVSLMAQSALSFAASWNGAVTCAATSGWSCDGSDSPVW